MLPGSGVESYSHFLADQVWRGSVVKVMEYERSVGCKVISFTGFDSGRLRKLADYPVHVDLHDMKRAEDCQRYCCMRWHNPYPNPGKDAC